MRATFAILSALTIVSSSLASPHSRQRRSYPLGRRSKSIFISPAALPSLPTVQAVDELDDALNTDNIQSDILVGMKKSQELFYFFKINDAATFKSKMSSDIIALITTTTEILSVDTQPVTAVNLAFSQHGLDTLGVTDDLGDPNFTNGQLSDLTGDLPGPIGDDESTWLPEFTAGTIDGVFLLASDTVDNIDTQLASIQSTLGSSITTLYQIQGAARPGSEAGHEHFGFMDGISQPAVNGFTNPIYPGQTPVDAGLFLVGEASDPNLAARPASGWATDGSFLVFRQLQQLVPEFNEFLTTHPLDQDTLTPEEGSELLGARMVGRWKSGAPIFLTPTQDDPVLAADPTRNNNFDYLDNSTQSNVDNHFNQSQCPFGAHIRKVHPRGDLDPSVENPHFIIRSSIPYGPELTASENATGISANDRGLAFVAYQSDISNGFTFLQNVWINSVGFPFGKYDPTVGVDPIIGTLNGLGAPKNISGLDPAVPDLDQTDVWHDVVLPTDYVISKGGEYFFSPSLNGLAFIAGA
ncbi:WD-REPEATS-REGION domain-containing protein [Mycena chlorophos]|uniref:WD-REPEATS-REGION domain-containing protein n=1 Tax=Mycena chlorophos TaxID=658473 RepID=A0A8H6SHZ6_MYCCL|nr:WD-REPEATS-REGION domain-containing protein [Mycena chlorophos]